MKQKILYIILMITAFLGRGEMVWAQNTYNVVDISTTQQIMDDVSAGKEKEYSWDTGPGKKLTFEVIGYNSWIFPFTGKCQVSVYNSANTELSNTSFDISTSWTEKTIDNLPRDAVKIIIKGTGTLKKEIRNVKVTRATTLTATPTSIPLGDVQLGETRQGTISVSWNNTYQGRTLRISDDDATNALSLTGIENDPIDMGALGKTSFSYTFLATTLGEYSRNIILSRNDGEVVTIPVTANVVGKYKPNIDCSLNKVYANHVYTLSDYISTENDAIPYTLTVDESVAKIIDGKLYVFAQSGNFEMIISQAETNEFYEETKTINLSIVNGSETVYKEKKNEFDIGSGGEKQLNFTFPTAKVTYSADLLSGGICYGVAVSTSKDHGNNWTQISERSTSSEIQYFTEIVEPTSTHIKFDRLGLATSWLYFDDIYFHMASYMTPSESNVTFDRTMKEQTSEVKTITIDWSDVEDYANNLKVFSDNSNFEVSVNQHNPCTPANETWGNSNQRWGQSTISITFKPNDTGNFSGNIYFYDNKRFITIPVSGEAYRPLVLNPGVNPSTQIIKEENYSQVVLERTFSAGYSTATFPFDYNISEVANAFAAQLKLVTYNSNDGYTLYFEKKGYMYANQPYVVYLPVEIKGSRNFGAKDIKVPDAQSIIVNGWTMQANYTPEFPMHGNYGIAGGLLCRGEGENAKINAYTAYFIPPTTQIIRTRVAILDEWGNATFIGEVKDGVLQTEEGIFGLDGVRQNELRKGINIVKTKDGTVRKVLK